MLADKHAYTLLKSYLFGANLAACAVSLLALFHAPALAQSGDQSKKTNILTLYQGDLGWANVSAYCLGVMGYNTPNINKFAPPSGKADEYTPPLSRKSRFEENG